MADQTPNSSYGLLQVNVINIENNFPVQNARITISSSENPRQTVEQLTTNTSGQTEQVRLPAPPVNLSLAPGDVRPYADYNVRIEADGFDPLEISGTEILADATAIQPAALTPSGDPEPENPVVIPDHTLYGSYPPKIAEAEIKPTNESGEIVLSRVVVPQTIVVHDGVPTDSSAKNYYVPYRDYIKNVASSEIYSTWPQASITANVLAIMSFTLNRVYTEWYRNQEIFDNYLSRPGVRQPILTQYCDGRQVQCPDWMTQWGSCELGQQGYSPIEILRYFYGDSIYINTSEMISGIPSSWPGYNLENGSSGPKVQQLQEQLDAIATVYTAIPRVRPDGIYGPATANSVREFQSVFGLPQTGVVDFATWYKISHIYVGITRIAELV